MNILLDSFWHVPFKIFGHCIARYFMSLFWILYHRYLMKTRLYHFSWISHRDFLTFVFLAHLLKSWLSLEIPDIKAQVSLWHHSGSPGLSSFSMGRNDPGDFRYASFGKFRKLCRCHIKKTFDLKVNQKSFINFSEHFLKRRCV